MQTYLALLRGINVGGHSLIKMPELKEALDKTELEGVRTYIQSGNVIFQSSINNNSKLASLIKTTIGDNFNLDVAVVVFSKQEWQKIIINAPSWWGKDQAWKHNLLALIQPYDMQAVMATIGELKPDIELLQAGEGVLYQSADIKMVGRATTGSKLASNKLYKKMTIRNYNTATKLLPLLD